VATDDLNAPLGQNATKTKRRLRLPVTPAQVIAGALALVVATFTGWALLANDPLGGEPMAVIATGAPTVSTVTPPTAPGTQPGAHVYSGPAPTQATPAVKITTVMPAIPAGPTVTIINGSTGNRVEVPIPTLSNTPAQPGTRLIEISRHGPIPQVGPDGLKPAEAYAKAVTSPANKPGAPRIALVITGLGVSSTATQDAISKLPGAVTLAFLPYGSEIGGAVTHARDAGHEVLLQLPMEPFDYPDNDPGPQTLLHSLTVEQNLDRLHWMMSRFQGYVGVANFMGARFTSTEPTLAPVLRDVAKRGLVYFDDASSPRSLAGQIAGANNLPFAKADVTLDSVASAAFVDKALAKLEASARQSGIAVGVATASTATIQRIMQWAKAAESRGFVLVPITAVTLKPKSS
jgi:hypothetical protein